MVDTATFLRSYRPFVMTALFLTFCFCAGNSQITNAQGPTSGGFAGLVRDKDTGEAIVGAKVIFRHRETGIQGVAVVTDATGKFSKGSLPPGDYEIEVTANGYESGFEIQRLFTMNTYRVRPDPWLLRRTRKQCSCPSLILIGPSDITKPGDPMKFKVYDADATVSYNWVVSAGTIESGQGTPAITVRTTMDMAGSNVTATVSIGGIDPACQCNITESETAGIGPRPARIFAAKESPNTPPIDVKKGPSLQRPLTYPQITTALSSK